MFIRRQLAVFALLTCYAVPAFAGRGLHGAERCVCLQEARVHPGHGHAGCSHDHGPTAPPNIVARLGCAARPHGLESPQDCDLCSYLAQSQCDLGPTAEPLCSEPVAAAPKALPAPSAVSVIGSYSSRAPPAFVG